MLIENQIELQHTCIYYWFKTGSSENQRIFNGENFVSCYGYRCCHVRRVLYKRSSKVKSFSDFKQSQLWNFHQYYSLQGINIFHKIYLIWQCLRTSFYNPGLNFEFLSANASTLFSPIYEYVAQSLVNQASGMLTGLTALDTPIDIAGNAALVGAINDFNTALTTMDNQARVFI